MTHVGVVQEKNGPLGSGMSARKAMGPDGAKLLEDVAGVGVNPLYCGVCLEFVMAFVGNCEYISPAGEWECVNAQTSV